MTKQLFFTLTITIFTLINISAQTVPNTQQAMITKITATWCPNCGGWGWDFYNNIYSDNADKALMLQANYSGELQNQVSQDFAQNFNVNYQPYFILGNTNQNVTSSNAASKRTIIKTQVDSIFDATPIANSGLLAELDGNTLNVTVRTRFFQETIGEYYLGVYVIEDGVVNFQQNQGDNAVHKNVLRTSMTNESFGVFLDDGVVEEFSEFLNEFSIQLGDWNVNNLEIAAIIWKKEGAAYTYINSNSTTELGTVGVTLIPEDEIGFDVYPTVSNSKITIAVDLKNDVNDVKLELFDPSGKKLETIFEGRSTSGLKTFELDKSMVNSNGLYFLMLHSGDKVSTKKVIFQ